MKPILILLHGAAGASDQLAPLANLLRDSYEVHCPDLPGHGKTPLQEPAFSIEGFGKFVLDYMDARQIAGASIVGYSMGGYVGLWLARNFPARIHSLVTLATKLRWDETTAAKEIKMLDPEMIQQKVPAFAAALAARHTVQDWKDLLAQTAGLLKSLGQGKGLASADFHEIRIPVLLLLGDQDKMVTIGETTEVFNLLPHAGLGILPFTAHPIDQTDPALLEFYIRRFVKTSTHE